MKHNLCINLLIFYYISRQAFNDNIKKHCNLGFKMEIAADIQM